MRKRPTSSPAPTRGLSRATVRSPRETSAGVRPSTSLGESGASLEPFSWKSSITPNQQPTKSRPSGRVAQSRQLTNTTGSVFGASVSSASSTSKRAAKAVSRPLPAMPSSPCVAPGMAATSTAATLPAPSFAPRRQPSEAMSAMASTWLSSPSVRAKTSGAAPSFMAPATRSTQERLVKPSSGPSSRLKVRPSPLISARAYLKLIHESSR